MHVNKYIPFYLQVQKLKKADLHGFSQDYADERATDTDKAVEEVYDKQKVSQLIEFD